MISTIDQRAQGVADELGLTDVQCEVVAVALAALAFDMAQACDAWAPVWRDCYTRKIEPHQLATAVWAMGHKIRLYAQGKDVEIMPGVVETPADKEQTEDARVFGDGAWVYCKQHCKPHQTGWCGVGVRDKVALGVDNAQDALQKCRDWGFDLYQDRSA